MHLQNWCDMHLQSWVRHASPELGATCIFRIGHASPELGALQNWVRHASPELGAPCISRAGSPCISRTGCASGISPHILQRALIGGGFGKPRALIPRVL